MVSVAPSNAEEKTALSKLLIATLSLRLNSIGSVSLKVTISDSDSMIPVYCATRIEFSRASPVRIQVFIPADFNLASVSGTFSPSCSSSMVRPRKVKFDSSSFCNSALISFFYLMSLDINPYSLSESWRCA